ncbi:MAG TPA: HAMP domain-containing sensor histidine kinase [Pseudonocardiaceae bacterium]|nr:HAMP domain-containing sensor histidine kinase [Pseudonocardiaceae bacterium]
MRTRDRSADERIIRRATRRIALQTAVAVAAAVLGLTTIAALVVLRGQHAADDRSITTTIEIADDVTDPPAGMWLVMRENGRQEVGPGLPAGLPDQSQLDLVSADGVARSADVTVDGRDYRVDTRRRPDGDVVQAVLDLSADHAERARLLEAYLISGAVGLVVASVIGLWLGRRAVAPLAEALALQRRFVADAGHELRTPLTLLSTSAQFAQRALGPDPDVETARSDVDRLVADTAHLTAVLDDLLLAADPRQAHVDEVVAMNDLVEDTVESARPLAERHGVALAWVDDGGRSAVLGSPASLRRAVTALLDNAIRHADGSVCATVGVDGGDVVVDVHDDGPGVAPEVMVTMFNRFATVPSGGRPVAPRRYGLGLALVSEVAAQHGGGVSVVDSGRRGATLRLRLPATEGMDRTDHERS